MAPPALDDDLCLREGVEDFPVEKLVPEPGVERLDEAVFPRRSRRDVGRLRSDCSDPLLDGLRNELRAVIRANVAGHAAQDEEIGQNVYHIGRFEPPIDPDRQAFMGKLIDDVEHPVFLSLVGAVFDEVITPDVVRVLRPQPDAGAISQPEPGLLRLPGRNFEPLAPPEAFNPLVVHHPARGRAQKLRDLPIAISAILADQGGNVVD